MDCYRLRMLYTVICKGERRQGKDKGKGKI